MNFINDDRLNHMRSLRNEARININELQAKGDNMETEDYQQVQYEEGFRDAMSYALNMVETKPVIFYIHAKHARGNDVNGNPRRFYFVYEVKEHNINMIDILWEGYQGRTVVTNKYPNAFDFATDMALSAKDYKYYYKMWQEMSKRD
jgi:hypothetical protein